MADVTTGDDDGLHRRQLPALVGSDCLTVAVDPHLSFHCDCICCIRLRRRCTTGLSFSRNQEEATADQTIESIFQLTEMIGAAIIPGNPITNLYFTLYGSNVIAKARSLTQDLKLGREFHFCHFCKIRTKLGLIGFFQYL